MTSETAPQEAARHEAALLVEALRRGGLTLAVAESLTGGMLASTVVGTAGASRVLRGGVVSYATDVKASLLGVDARLLAERGAVDAQVATQMATGVRRALGADVALATTGVAGPQPQDGHPVGHVFVAAVRPGRGAEPVSRVLELRLDGDRQSIRAQTVLAALRLGQEAVAQALAARRL